MISASTASDGATQKAKKRCCWRAKLRGTLSVMVNLDPGLLQILDRLGLRLLQRLAARLLLGGDALDRLVDLVADLRIDRHGAVFHVAGLAAELQHLEDRATPRPGRSGSALA